MTDYAIEILHAGQRVASHPRSASQGRHTTISAHMPASHLEPSAPRPGELLERPLVEIGQQIGDGAIQRRQ